MSAEAAGGAATASLEACLAFLKTNSTEHKFAGLLLASKLLTNRGYAAKQGNTSCLTAAFV